MVVLNCADNVVGRCVGVRFFRFVPVTLSFFRIDKDVLAFDVDVGFVGCGLELI